MQKHNKHILKASEMAQRVKALTDQLGDPRSIPHGGQREVTVERYSLTVTCTPWQTHALTHMYIHPYILQ